MRRGAALFGRGAGHPAGQADEGWPPGPASIAPSSSSASTSRPAPRPRSTSCCATSRELMKTLESYTTPDLSLMAKSDIRPVTLAQALIRCPSVTPHEAGALGRARSGAEPLGFNAVACRSAMGTARVDNLYARLGQRIAAISALPAIPMSCRSATPRMDASIRSLPRFARTACLIGRGAADMKGADRLLSSPAAALRASAARAQRLDQPSDHRRRGRRRGQRHRQGARLAEGARRAHRPLRSSASRPIPKRLGDMIKIGRRGSLSGQLTSTALRAMSPIRIWPIIRCRAWCACLRASQTPSSIEGTEHFQPSNLEVDRRSTSAIRPTNVIPGEVYARFNIRFNDRHTRAGLEDWARGEFERFKAEAGERYRGQLFRHGRCVPHAARPVHRPHRRSDPHRDGGSAGAFNLGRHLGRPLHQGCRAGRRVGLIGATMHKVDEHVAVADIEALSRIYERILRRYFESFAGPP